MSQPQAYSQCLSELSPERGIKADLFLTFASHSTLKVEKSVSGLTSILECTFWRELKIKRINICSSFYSPLSWRRKTGTEPALSWEKICPSLFLLGSLLPFQIYLELASKIESFLRVSRTSCFLTHCWCSGHWSTKIWDSGVHLMGKKYTSFYYPWLRIRIYLVRLLKFP